MPMASSALLRALPPRGRRAGGRQPQGAVALRGGAAPSRGRRGWRQGRCRAAAPTGPAPSRWARLRRRRLRRSRGNAGPVRWSPTPRHGPAARGHRIDPGTGHRSPRHWFEAVMTATVLSTAGWAGGTVGGRPPVRADRVRRWGWTGPGAVGGRVATASAAGPAGAASWPRRCRGAGRRWGRPAPPRAPARRRRASASPPQRLGGPHGGAGPDQVVEVAARRCSARSPVSRLAKTMGVSVRPQRSRPPPPPRHGVVGALPGWFQPPTEWPVTARPPRGSHSRSMVCEGVDSSSAVEVHPPSPCFRPREHAIAQGPPPAESSRIIEVLTSWRERQVEGVHAPCP